MIAFPHSDPKLQAQGFGKDATGGRNGKVILINTINDPTLTTELIDEYEAAGAGSFRWAMTRTYARIIIPVVAGYVDLVSNVQIESTSMGDFTYLGFLAPGDGLVIRYRAIRISRFSNAIIRGLKARYSDISGSEGTPLGGAAIDPPLSNVIIDRSSFSWGTDQTCSPSRAENITIQYTIISETLNDSVHSKGRHSFNTLFGGHNFSFHNSLITSGIDRNPLFQGNSYWVDCLFDFRNCVMFNTYTPFKTDPQPNIKANMIRNLYDEGPATGTTQNQRICLATGSTAEDTARIFVWGNKLTARSLADDTATQKTACHLPTGALTEALRDTVFVNDEFSIPVGTYAYNTRAETETQIRERIRDYVGYPVRDSVDTRIINQWQNSSKNGSGIWSTTPPFAVGSVTGITGIIDSQNDVGGFPDLTGGTYPTSTANDGIPDTWKIANGLDVNIDYGISGTPETQAFLFAPSGYRWVEEYSFWLLENTSIDPPTIPPVLEGVRFCRIQEPIV